MAIAIVLTIRWADSAFVQRAETKGLGIVRQSAGSSRALASKAWVDPMRKIDDLRATEEARYQGSGRDIFRVVMDRVRRKETVHSEREEILTIRHEEAEAPFPLTFFGFSRKGRTNSVFLLGGDDVFIAHEGDIVDRRYRIVRVTPNSVEVEDVLKQKTQTLWLRG